jgi:hypothetical protein
MSKKSRLSIVVALTALLTILFALVFPAVCLESSSFNENDITYIFGFTSTFGGVVIPQTGVICPLTFNWGAFLAILFVLIGAGLVVLFDRQVSSYAFALILSLVSLVLFLLAERFVTETNGVISGFTTYLYTGFGTYVSIGFCSLIAIECAIGMYIIKADSSRRRR